MKIYTSLVWILFPFIFACNPAAHEDRPTIYIFSLMRHPLLDASIQGTKASLVEHGYGPDVVDIREINANGQTNLLSAYAREIVALHPSVIVPVSTPVSQAIVRVAPPSQAVVYSTIVNPEDLGIAASATNITGVSDAVDYEANIDLLIELFPSAAVVGMIYNPAEVNSRHAVEAAKQICQKLNRRLVLVPVGRPEEVADATRSLVGTVDAIYVGTDNTVVSALPGLTEIAEAARLPVIASDSGSVEKGALAAASVDYFKLGHKVGDIVAEILQKKVSPGTIPRVKMYGRDIILNQRAAAKIQYSFPEQTLRRAVRIIQ